MSLTKKQIEAAQNACLEQYHCSPSGQMLETIASHVQMASEAEPPSEEEVIVADEAYDETDSFDRSYAPMRNSLTAVFKGRSDRIKALEKKCADWEAEFSEARQDALKASVAMHKIADERDALKAESERRKIIVLTCLSCRKSFKDLKMLSDHIGVCEKHPMRALKDKLEDLLASSVTEDQVREAVVLAHDYLHTSIHSGQDVSVEVCARLFPKKEKTLEERVTVTHNGSDTVVLLDDKLYCSTFSFDIGESIREYLIAQLKKSSKEGE